MTFGVSLDFFNTLVEIDLDVPTIGGRLTELGFPCSAAVEMIWNSNGFDGQATHNPSEVRYADWHRSNIVALSKLCGVPEADVERVSDELLALDKQWTVRARDGAIELLSAIRNSGLRYCILTNWDYPLAPYLEMAGLDPIPAVISAETGFRKPMVQAFDRARALMKIDPINHVHIGDSWNADVVGAIRSGARAIWIIDQPPTIRLPTSIVASNLLDASERLGELLAGTA